MSDQPFIDNWPLWDEPLSKITAALDIAAAREKLARRFNRRPVRLPKAVEIERACRLGATPQRWAMVTGALQFLLCRTEDVYRPCCRNLAYHANGKLWCVDCKRPRGKLSPKVIEALSKVIAIYPEARNQVHILRDKTELPNETEPAADTVARDTSASEAPLEHDGQPEVC